MRSYINLPTFNIQMSSCYFSRSLVTFIRLGFLGELSLIWPECLSCFAPECHISGRSNMFGFLWSQKEVKHFHDVSRSEATPSSQNHISESWWRMLCLRAVSVASQWKTCRAVPAPVAPTAQDTHPLQPVGTPRMLHYCWLMESFPSFLQHITFLLQTAALGIATCQNWTVAEQEE